MVSDQRVFDFSAWLPRFQQSTRQRFAEFWPFRIYAFRIQCCLFYIGTEDDLGNRQRTITPLVTNKPHSWRHNIMYSTPVFSSTHLWRWCTTFDTAISRSRCNFHLYNVMYNLQICCSNRINWWLLTILLLSFSVPTITFYWTVPLCVQKCLYKKSVRILKVLKLLFQQFSNLLISERDMSGPRLGALFNNRWSGVLKGKKINFLTSQNGLRRRFKRCIGIWV